MSSRNPAELSSYAFPEELRVDDLIVRPPNHDGVEQIVPAFVDPLVGGEAGLPPFDSATLHAFVDSQLEAMRTAGLLAPYVIEDSQNGELLGSCAMHHLDRTRDAVEIGYWLFVGARGRGVATRIVRALCEHAFAGGINRVEAVVRPANAASVRVLERAGFRAEGVRRSLLRYEGVRVDARLFARLVVD